MRDLSPLAAFRYFFLFLFLGGAAGALVLTWNYLNISRQGEDDATRRASQLSSHASEALDAALSSVTSAAHRLVTEIRSGPMDETRMTALCGELFAHNPAISGIGFAYRPGAPVGVRLYGRYCTRTPQGGTEMLRLEQLYDYSRFENRWWHDPMLDGAMWNEPYVIVPNRPRVVGYAMPIEPAPPNQAAAPLGTAFINVSMEQIRNLVDSASLGRLGYSFIFSREGRYISHPRQDWVSSGRTVFETAWDGADTSLHSMAIRGIKGERGRLDHFDAQTGQSAWILYQPLRSSGWILVSVFDRSEVRLNPNIARGLLIRITIAALVSLLGLIMLVTTRWMRRTLVVWIGVLLVGTSLAAGIALVWLIYDRNPAGEQRLMILERTGLEQFLGDYTQKSREVLGSTPVYLPTGVFIKSLEFVSGSNVKVTGYVWQAYRRGEHDGLARAFLLPDAESADVKEAYRYSQADREVVGWSFAATLRQRFAYDKYPFDRQDVTVRLQHADFQRNVVLIPALESYSATNPAARPGMEAGLVVDEWVFEESFFDYGERIYNTDFGGADRVAGQGVPELRFHMVVRREFIEPFISRVLPLAIAVALLFTTTMLGSKRPGTSLLGFSAMNVIRTCAALFVAVIFSQVSLRQTFRPAGIMYIEHFYFVTYLALLAVSVNSIAFGSHLQLRIIEYRDNLIAKLAFWPLFLGALFIITAVIFY